MVSENWCYQQGIEKARQKDLHGAIAEFTQAIQAQPDFAAAYYQRGLAYFNLGNAPQAILDYANAIRLDPTNASYYFGRGLAYLTQSNLREALSDANQAVRLRPDHAPTYSLRGTLCQRLGDITEAIASYKQAAQRYLDQKDAANGRHCLEQIERLQRPPAAPEVPPSSVEVTQFIQQALAKAEAGNDASAIADLDWTLQLDPQDAQAYFSRAQVREKMGDDWSALSDYRNAAQIFAIRADKPMLQKAITAIEHLKAAQKRTRTASFYRVDFSATDRGLVVQTTPLSRAVQNKLLKLVADDRKTAIRLVNQLKMRNPGMPEDWYWEKAIYDLERDRWR